MLGFELRVQNRRPPEGRVAFCLGTLFWIFIETSQNFCRSHHRLGSMAWGHLPLSKRSRQEAARVAELVRGDSELGIVRGSDHNRRRYNAYPPTWTTVEGTPSPASRVPPGRRPFAERTLNRSPSECYETDLLCEQILASPLQAGDRQDPRGVGQEQLQQQNLQLQSLLKQHLYPEVIALLEESFMTDEEGE